MQQHTGFLAAKLPFQIRRSRLIVDAKLQTLFKTLKKEKSWLRKIPFIRFIACYLFHYLKGLFVHLVFFVNICNQINKKIFARFFELYGIRHCVLRYYFYGWSWTNQRNIFIRITGFDSITMINRTEKKNLMKYNCHQFLMPFLMTF